MEWSFTPDQKAPSRDIFAVSKKSPGRPRKTPPLETDFALWLREFMKEKGLTVAMVAAALTVRGETVYGWLAGEKVDNEKMAKTSLVAIYGEAERGPLQQDIGPLPDALAEGQ